MRFLQGATSTVNVTVVDDANDEDEDNNEPVVTGTGVFEGWYGVMQPPANATSNFTWTTMQNVWGKDLREDLSYYTKFGEDYIQFNVDENTAWNLNARSANNYTRAINSVDGKPHFYASVWRLASALDGLKFNFKTGVNYYGHIGHRYWPKNITSGNAIMFNNTADIGFTFESATSLNAIGIAAALVLGFNFF